MKAIIGTKYGPPDILKLKDVDKPVPKENELLIKIHAATVYRTDSGLQRAKPFISRFITGIFKPKESTPGSEFAGEIESFGKSVKSLGAGKLIDFTKEDFTKDDQVYDYVFDTVGKSSFSKCKSLLKPGGVYISSELGYKAVIDRKYPLEQIVEAYKYIERGQKIGNVVIIVEQD